MATFIKRAFNSNLIQVHSMKELIMFSSASRPSYIFEFLPFGQVTLKFCFLGALPCLLRFWKFQKPQKEVIQWRVGVQ